MKNRGSKLTLFPFIVLSHRFRFSPLLLFAFLERNSIVFVLLPSTTCGLIIPPENNEQQGNTQTFTDNINNFETFKELLS